MPSRTNQPGSDSLSLIEKVIVLKSVDLFARVPDSALCAVAASLGEIRIAAGQPVFHKGDPGDAMYLVVAGRLRVHDGAQTIDGLAEHQVFGEMALLDAQPRSASVTAVEDSLLLRLDQDDFDDLLAGQPAVGRGLILVLSERLRARLGDLARLEGTKPAERDR